MNEWICLTAQETKALGRRIAAMLRTGDTVLLAGDMGAGKSELARGIARGLGVVGAVPSPSFTILNVYQTATAPLYHFDWYRIADPGELYEMGLDEFVGGDGIALIEWFERAPECVPQDALRIEIEPQNDHSRRITLRPLGAFRNIGELL